MELYIAPSSLVAAKLQEVGITPRHIIACDDRLSFGPVSRDVSLSEPRSSFWRHIYDLTTIGRGLAPQLNDFLRLFDRSDDLRAADQITIWGGPSLDEGLHLLWLQAALRKLSIDLGKIALIYVDTNPKTERHLPSLAVLPSEAINAALQTAIKVSSTEWEQLDRFWQAFTSNDPADLNRVFIRSQTDVPKWIWASFPLLSRRFPQKGVGLPYHIASLLRLLTPSPVPFHVALARFLASHADERDLPGDLVLEAQLRQLATPVALAPLVELHETGDGTTVEAAITADGVAVVSGVKDNLALNRIDEWVGGVHLINEAHQSLEFDPDTNQLVRRTFAQM